MNEELTELLDEVIERLEHNPSIVRDKIWDMPETLNVSGINEAAQQIGIGPIFEIGDADPKWSWPNLPKDDPNNQVRLDRLTVFTPTGNAFDVCLFVNPETGLREIWSDSKIPPSRAISRRLQYWKGIKLTPYFAAGTWQIKWGDPETETRMPHSTWDRKKKELQAQEHPKKRYWFRFFVHVLENNGMPLP